METAEKHIIECPRLSRLLPQFQESTPMSTEHRIWLQRPPSRAIHRVLIVLASAGAIVAPHSLPADEPAQPMADAQPAPKLSPEDVVRAQMKSLSAAGSVQTRIDRCYRFASPANRAHTGPIQRFATMIQSPKYAVLLNAKHFLVGRAMQNGREAHLLLTVVDANGNLSLFRCFLSKQTAAPYADCWMTDAVIRVGEVGPAPNRPERATQPTPSI